MDQAGQGQNSDHLVRARSVGECHWYIRSKVEPAAPGAKILLAWLCVQKHFSNVDHIFYVPVIYRLIKGWGPSEHAMHATLTQSNIEKRKKSFFSGLRNVPVIHGLIVGCGIRKHSVHIKDRRRIPFIQCCRMVIVVGIWVRKAYGLGWWENDIMYFMRPFSL